MERLSLTTLLCIAVAVNKRRNAKKKKLKRCWVHPFHLGRLTEGEFHKNYPKIRSFPEEFFEYYKMSVDSFDELVSLVRDRIQKKTVLREPIGVEERLTVTLCYLSTGLNFTTISHNFRIAKQTIRIIVEKTCEAIWDALESQEMALPTTEEWTNISKQFLENTQFPNCVGAMDGKRIKLSRKHNKSIVLLAVADAEYRFRAISVEPYVQEKNCSILRESCFGKMLYDDQLSLPNPEKLPNADNNDLLPFVFLGDEDFPIHKNVLRPYPKKCSSVPKRIFNYRLTRARRNVECAFGILTNKWKVFQANMMVQPNFAVKVTKATCVLHNFVLARDDVIFEDTLSYSFGNGNDDDLDFGKYYYEQKAIENREKFAEYFISSSGEVPWQYNRLAT